MRILGRKFYAYKSKNRRKNTPDSAFPRTLGCLCVCHVFTFSNLFSGTAGPIEVKFHVEPPWDGGTNVCIWGPGHMTKMAAMPINNKNPSKFFSGTAGPICMKLGM